MAAPLVVLVCVLGANSASDVKLAAPQWSAANVKPDVAQFWTGHLAQQIHAQGPQVVTQEEISALLGAERQRQLMGCADGSSCMAELANALGTDGLIIGSVAHLGDEFQINLKIIASKDGKTLAQFSTRVRNEAGVIDELSRGAVELTDGMLQAMGVKARPVAASSGVSRRWWATVPAVLGLAGVVVGAGAMSAANSEASDLRDPNTTLSVDLARVKYQSALDKEHIGIGALIAGGVLIAGAAVLFFLLDEPPAVAFEPRSGGVTFAFDGVHW